MQLVVGIVVKGGATESPDTHNTARTGLARLLKHYKLCRERDDADTSQEDSEGHRIGY